ncbi:MAG: alpha-ketoglutarate-dependent dioxygenase AlkB [Microthrixaceae bacterium]|jgi:alkylated DNA repair protein (DNA oxidative demethylase)|nr:alpha-ketoglutarate-dependent dioxygenase AlkB [Microthrixaceae bacterium]
MGGLFPRVVREIAPGAVHLPDWLDMGTQRRVVSEARQWARPPGPMRRIRLPNGGTMSVETVSLGWHWVPYRYVQMAVDTDGSPVAPMPDWLVGLGRRAVDAAYGQGRGDDYRPDAALVNFYDDHAKLGMHQDHDELTDAPVVSFSVGDACVFRFGNTENRNKPYVDVQLAGGDAFVFGGATRLAYHGVLKTIPGTGDPATGLDRGRLNITLRVTGLGAGRDSIGGD